MFLALYKISSMHIFTEYSLWWLPLCVVVGLATAFLLYRKNDKLREAPRWVRRLLFGLRAFVVAMLLFLLLGPYIEMRRSVVEKPTIVLLHDNSASLVLQKDSAKIRTEYVAAYQKFADELRETYTVDEYTFGSGLVYDSALNFSERETNISQALQDVAVRYYKQNLGAVVLATDGIYNAGENPKYATQNMSATTPIYTVALGDTVQECDNVISKVLHNKIAFRNNPFTIKVSVESHSLKGKQSTLTIRENNAVVFERSFTAQSAHAFKTLDCKLTSNEIGKKMYTISITYFNEEISEKNNTYTFAVDVLESKQKILLAYEAVHPDVAALRRAIESNKNYDCDVVCLSDDKAIDVSAYNCLMLVGLPTAFGKGKSLLSHAVEAGVPSLIVYNQAMSVDALNAQNVGVAIENFRNSYDEVKPAYQSDFSLFQLDEASKTMLEQAPPLLAPFGNYTVGVQSKMLCNQIVETIEVARPLVAFSQIKNTKVGMVLGEGLWRWRLFDKKTNGSFAAFDSFVNKMIAYLALTEKRELFSVNGENIISDNQDALFTAELYDKSYEPMPNQEISMTVRNEAGKEFPFSFIPNDNFYVLNAGKFPQGKYTYAASVKIDGGALTKSGSFFVLPLQTEYKQTRANHDLLSSLSEESGGVMVSPNDFDTLLHEIRSNQNIVAVSHTTRNRSLALDLPLILIVIIVAASAEWFFRKYYATY